jgi:hypothetical protein
MTETASTPEQSVNDIPDAELLGRVIRRHFNGRGRGRRKPRWVWVSDRFALGSTYARQLCRRYGVDPDDEVGA